MKENSIATRRVRGNLIYVTLRDGMVYIECDGTEHGITDNLIARGIPEDCIVLAFLPDAPTVADTRFRARLSRAKSARPAVPYGA